MLMFDSVNAAAIPRTASMVALYGDGRYKNYDIRTAAVNVGTIAAPAWVPIRDRFPQLKRPVVVIAATGYLRGAHAYDCERGDFTPDQLAQVVAIAVRNGEHPLSYFSKDRFGEVLAAFKAHGIAGALEVWVADWTGRNHVVPGTWGTQWADPALGSGGAYDVSTMAEQIPGLDPPSPAPPTPAPPAPPVTAPPAAPPAPVDPVPPAPPVVVTPPAPPVDVTPPDWAEPAPVAEAGVTTSEWRLVVGYFAQLAGVGTADVVNAISQTVFHASVQIPPAQLSAIVGLEFALAIPVAGYAISRAIRKFGTNG